MWKFLPLVGCGEKAVAAEPVPRKGPRQNKFVVPKRARLPPHIPTHPTPPSQYQRQCMHARSWHAWKRYARSNLFGRHTVLRDDDEQGTQHLRTTRTSLARSDMGVTTVARSIRQKHTCQGSDMFRSGGPSRRRRGGGVHWIWDTATFVFGTARSFSRDSAQGQRARHARCPCRARCPGKIARCPKKGCALSRRFFVLLPVCFLDAISPAPP